MARLSALLRRDGGIASLAVVLALVLLAGVALSGVYLAGRDDTAAEAGEGDLQPAGESTGEPTPDATAPDEGATDEAAPAETATPEPTPREHVQAVVSAHELATDAGIEILGNGGTAADAAVGVAAVLSVVEPWFSSALGGGTWALYYDADDGSVTSLDGVGPAGSDASLADYRGKAGSSGMHQAVVPGAWDGWMLWLERYGELDLREVLAPAIRIAREGYPVSEEMAEWLDRSSGVVANRPPVARIYIQDGRRVREGDTVRQVAMADTFEALADAYDERLGEGRAAAIQAARDHFYRGPIAEAIVDFSDANGGYLTLEDFHGFEAEIVEPLAVDYRDVTVYQNPPNSQGITMLIALNILDGYDFSGLSADDPDAVHRQVEAVKLGFADRHYHVGDPDRVDVPVEALLSDAHAERQRSRIEPDRALGWPIEDVLVESEAPAHTTTFHVVDVHGNGAAVTTSLGAQFLVIGDTGIHINNRMRFFSLEPGNPNVLEPGRKVRHTSNPYMALRDGRPYILGGNTGVDTQPQGQLQQVVNVVDFGLSAQEAVDRPRWVSRSFPATTVPHQYTNNLQVESAMPSALREGLRAKGHSLAVDVGTFGSAGMIILDEDGTQADVGAESRDSVATGRVVEPQ